MRAFDCHVGRVVVVEEEGDQIEPIDPGWHRIVERLLQRRHPQHGRRTQAQRKALLGARVHVGGILCIDDAGRTDRARQEFGAVAAARPHIEHLHAAPHADEGQKLLRMAALVDRTVGIGAIFGGNDLDVVRHTLRRCADDTAGYEQQRQCSRHCAARHRRTASLSPSWSAAPRRTNRALGRAHSINRCSVADAQQ